jgi:hypothetical protein
VQHVSLSGVASFLLAFSDSEHTTEDSDFHVDEEQGVVGFDTSQTYL